MNNKDVFTDEEINALNLLINDYEKYISKIGKNGGFVAKKKISKITKKARLIPLYISGEFASQILNRKRLYDNYILLEDFATRCKDPYQKSLAQSYMNLFDKVQNICKNLKDDEQVTKFIEYLSKKCVTDFNLDIDIIPSSLFSLLPISTSFIITKIAPPTESDLNYIKSQSKHIDELLATQEEEQSL